MLYYGIVALDYGVEPMKKLYALLRQNSRLVRTHLLLLALLAALTVYGCPFYRLLHIRCPGCGLTHAWLSFLRGDVRRALEYHLFFLPMPLFIVLFIHRDVKVLRKWRRPIDLSLYALVFLVFVYHILRSVYP